MTTHNHDVLMAINSRIINGRSGGAKQLNADYKALVKARDEIIKIRKALAEQPAQQEPVAWGVDWGKAGDIPCVSIIKRLPGGGIEVVAVEYAPYSYTFPTAQRTWVPDAMTHNEGETAEYVAGWNDCREFMLRKRNPK